MKHFPVALVVMALLGPSLAISQTAPRAPTALCIDNEPCVSTPTLSGGDIKWHPGHYVGTDAIERPGNDPKNASISSMISSVENTPFVGVHALYGWTTLEPTKGGYDFSRIRAHRDALSKIGKRLIIQIQDRNFSGDGPPPAYAMPPYLLTDPEYEGGWTPRGNGSGTAPKLWLGAVMDRQIALHKALAAQFDNDPWIELVSSEETALYNVLPPGYSQSAMDRQYRRLADAMSAAWQHTNACIPTNFFYGLTELRNLMDYFISKRICVGGPDVRPDNKIAGSKILSGQFDGIDRRGSTAIFFHNEWGSLDGRWTVEQLQDYAHNTNGQHYNSWFKKESTPGLTFSRDVRPWVISTNPPTHTKCPTNYQNRCTSK